MKPLLLSFLCVCTPLLTGCAGIQRQDSEFVPRRDPRQFASFPADLELVNKGFKQRYDDLQDTLIASHARTKQLEHELESLQSSQSAVHVATKQFEHRIDELQDSCLGAEAEVQRLKTLLSKQNAISQRASELHSVATQWKAYAEDLEQQLKESQAQVAKLQESSRVAQKTSRVIHDEWVPVQPSGPTVSPVYEVIQEAPSYVIIEEPCSPQIIYSPW